MKKYILLIFVLITVIFAVTSCNSETYYCKKCDREVTINEAILCDGPIYCDHCGHTTVYSK